MRAYIDFETKSEVDLKKVGLHNYATHPTTDVWCMSYHIEQETDSVSRKVVRCWRPDKSPLDCPQDVDTFVHNGGVVVAHNAAFEYAMWRHILVARYGWPPLDLAQLRCTMAAAYAMSLPGSLEMAGAALGLPVGKDKTGYALMLRMMKPAKYIDKKPVWTNELKSFTFMGEKVTGEWALDRLCEYCNQDVAVERQIDKRIMQLSLREQALWVLDQKINMRGIHFDMDAVYGARRIRDAVVDSVDRGIDKVTGGAVAKTTSLPALKAWLADRGVIPESLDKKSIGELLDLGILPPDVTRALELRRLAGRASSVKKLDAVALQQFGDRLRYTLQYHGAGTGRWAGRGLQPHNLPRDLPKPIVVDELMRCFAAGPEAMPWLEIYYGGSLESISQCLRGFITAAPGNELMGGDWSNIEGRGVAWLAGEQWKLDAFAACDADPDGPDIYEQSAAATLGIPVEEVTAEQRQSLGKVPELAMAYQGGVGAFQSMAKIYDIDVSDERADEIKNMWRDKHPAIAGVTGNRGYKVGGLWRNTEAAAIRAVQHPGEITSNDTGFGNRALKFRTAGSFLWMLLPSGRLLCYPYPEIHEGKWGRDMLTYKTSPGAKEWTEGRIIYEPGQSRNWARVSTYGGKLVENATQAVCRDILAEGIAACEEAGLKVVMHVHDEIIVEGDFVEREVNEFNNIMNHQPTWAAGFPIAADTWQAVRYQK